jgi:hypothetical protein
VSGLFNCLTSLTLLLPSTQKLVEQKKQAAQGHTGVGVQNGGFVGKDLLSIVGGCTLYVS